MSTKVFFVYGLIDPRTGQLRYVGRSSTGMRRPREHLSTFKLAKEGSTHKANWIRGLKKNGFNPEIGILERVTSSSSLNEAEMFWIAYAKMIGCNLTNMTNGGDGGQIGRKLSAETKAKIGKANKGKKMIWTEEARQRLSDTITGRKVGPHTDKARLRISKSKGGKPFVDNLGNFYLTQHEAARKLDIDQGGISVVLLGKQPTYKGYTFTYAE